ncbi:MAG: hypothetical protein EOP90_02275 [Lysobacteraceae bacterium]|nr:MAG: hypothetical protein EOP90_02275 [Xanthomonadaceae bacterium]
MRRVLVLLLCVAVVACARRTDADAVRARIAGIAAAAESREVGDVMDAVSADFVGNDGLDRAQLASLVRAQVLGGGAVDVSLGNIEVEVHGDRATARFGATLTDGSGRWIPDRRARLAFETGWRREDGDWACYNASWSREED